MVESMEPANCVAAGVTCNSACTDPTCEKNKIKIYSIENQKNNNFFSIFRHKIEHHYLNELTSISICAW